MGKVLTDVNMATVVFNCELSVLFKCAWCDVCKINVAIHVVFKVCV